MKIKFLLIGASLSFLPQAAFAQCVATQDCETLGYTKKTCNGGKGVKCPFGNKWACLGANEDEVRDKVCQELGFTLTCTGTGYAGGAGSACGGKYIQCNCASGYEWKDGGCQILNGPAGDVYKCNGVVVGIKTSGMNFYVSVKDLGVMGWSEAKSSCSSYSFCGNFKGILPSKDQLLTMYNNKSSLNSLLSANGGENLINDYYWSSTIYGTGSYGSRYVVNMSNGNAADSNFRAFVRPVLVNY